MSVISIDYDNTYTEDPEMFEQIMELMRKRGHQPVIVTARNKDKHPVKSKFEVFYTDGKEKAPFMREAGLEVDIWVDDWPELIGKTRVIGGVEL